MKTRIRNIILVLLCIIGFACFLFITPRGIVKNVEVIEVSSELYTEEEIQKVIKVIKEHFKKEMRGCELLKLRYIGDTQNESVVFQYLDKQYGVSEHIVFEIVFKVGNRDRPAFRRNSIHEIVYILGKDQRENWKYLDSGKP